MKARTTQLLALNLIILVLGIFTSLHFANYPHDKTQDDVYYLWQEGQRIVQGKNPYENIRLTVTKTEGMLVISRSFIYSRQLLRRPVFLDLIPGSVFGSRSFSFLI